MTRIDSELITLREVDKSDLEAMETYHRDSRYLEHYDRAPDTWKILSDAMKWANEEPRTNYQFAITLAGKTRMIGCAGIRCLNYAKDEGEIGIELAANYWGKGLASETLTNLIEFALSLGLKKLHAATKQENARALHLMQSRGFLQKQVVGSDVRLSKNLNSVTDGDVFRP